MSTERLRVGLIGAGEVVRTIHIPVLQKHPKVEILWIMDVNGTKAAALAKGFGIPQAHAKLNSCQDVDAVLIAVPVGARAALWEEVIEKKWHVLCEKPVAQSAAEYDRIAERMAGSARVFASGLMRRFYANTLLVQRLVQSKIFGELEEVWAGEGGRMTKTGRGSDWYQTDRSLAGGGILIETGSHLLDQIMFITQADNANLDQYEQSPQGLTMEFSAHLRGQLGLKHNRRVPMQCSLSRAHDICNAIFLRFSNLIVRLDHGPDGVIYICDRDAKPITALETQNHGAQNSMQAFYLEWDDFIKRCQHFKLDKERDDYHLTRLAVGLIENCYMSVSKNTEHP